MATKQGSFALGSPSNSVVSHLTSIIQQKGFKEEEVWGGSVDLMVAIAPFRTELKKASQGHSGTIKINLPNVPELQGTRSKIYKIWAKSSMREILQMVCKKLGLAQSDQRFLMTTLGGFVLDEREMIGAYGFGTLLLSWELTLHVSPLSQLFGASLPSTFTRQVHTDAPHIIVHTIQAIKKSGNLASTDLFTSPCTKERVIHLKKQFEYYNGEGLNLLSEDVNDLASLLLLYLAQTPTPLFPKSFRRMIPIEKQEPFSEDDIGALVTEVLECLKLASPLENELVRYFLEFLSVVHQEGGVSVERLAGLLASRLFLPLEARKKLHAAVSKTQSNIGLVRRRFGGEKKEEEKKEEEKKGEEEKKEEEKKEEKEGEEGIEREKKRRSASPKKKRSKEERASSPKKKRKKKREIKDKSASEISPVRKASRASESDLEALVKNEEETKPAPKWEMRRSSSTIDREVSPRGPSGPSRGSVSLSPRGTAGGGSSPQFGGWKRTVASNQVLESARKLERADTMELQQAFSNLDEIEKLVKEYTQLLSFLIIHFSKIFPNHKSESFNLLTGLDYLDGPLPSPTSSNETSLPTSPSLSEFGASSPRGIRRDASSVESKKMKTKQIEALIEGFEAALRDRDSIIEVLYAKNTEQENRLMECDSRLAMLIDELKAKEENITMLDEKMVEKDDRILELEGDLDSAVEEKRRVGDELEVCESTLQKVGEELEGKIEELGESQEARAAERTEFENERALLEGALEESESNNEDLKAENDSLGTQITSLDSQLASAQQSLESANEAHQKEAEDLSEEISKLQNKLTEKEKMLMESAATDQAMRQMMEASHKQIEELREEISNLKSQNKGLQENLQNAEKSILRAKEQNEKAIDTLNKEHARKNQQWENEKKNMVRDHDRAIEDQKREVASRQHVIDNFEKRTEGLRTQAKESVERAAAAQARLDEHLVALKGERRKCAEAERKNWTMKNEHNDVVRRLKKEISLRKKEQEILKEKLETLMASASTSSSSAVPSPSPSPSSSSSPPTESSGPPGNVPAPPPPADLEAKDSPKPLSSGGLAALLSAQKGKLQKVEETENEQPPPPSTSGGTILASLAQRFQTIRQLESEDLRNEEEDEDEFDSDFDEDEDDDYFY